MLLLLLVIEIPKFSIRMIVKLAAAVMCYIGLGEVVHVYAMKAYGGVELLLHPFFNPPTCYGVDGPGTEFRWGEIFRTLPKRQWGAHPASCTMGTGSLSRG
jgi:hypothetical protein